MAAARAAVYPHTCQALESVSVGLPKGKSAKGNTGVIFPGVSCWNLSCTERGLAVRISLSPEGCARMTHDRKLGTASPHSIITLGKNHTHSLDIGIQLTRVGA